MDETSVRARLDAQNWGNILERLRDFATHRCGSAAQGKDLAQGAIMRVYSKWDPEKDPDLLRHLMSVVNSLLANERTSAGAQRNLSLTKARTRAKAERVTDGRALAEATIVESDLAARRVALLKERLAGDGHSLQLLELMIGGVDTPAEVIAVTGWTPASAAATRRRMLRAAAGVARDLGAETDEDRAVEAHSDEEEVA